MTNIAELPACPGCGSTTIDRVVYGYPSFEMADASQRGEIVLGGCMVGPESPDYVCRSCRRQLPWAANDEWSRDPGFDERDALDDGAEQTRQLPLPRL